MTTKGNPIPVRFDKVDEDELKELSGTSGFSMRALIRSAVRYAIPRFKSGEANILTGTSAIAADTTPTTEGRP